MWGDVGSLPRGEKELAALCSTRCNGRHGLALYSQPVYSRGALKTPHNVATTPPTGTNPHIGFDTLEEGEHVSGT